MKKQQIIALLVSVDFVYLGYYNIKNIIANGSHFFADFHTPLHQVIFLFGVGGLVQFLVTDFRSSRFLRIWLYYSLFCCLVEILMVLLYLCLPHHQRYGYSSTEGIASVWIKSMWRIVPVIAGLYYCLIGLNESRVPSLEPYPAGEEISYIFNPVNKWMRFAIRLIDVGLVLVVMYYFASTFQVIIMGSGQFEYAVGSSLGIKILVEVLLFFYYLLMESTLRISFGKIVTNTVIVNETGQKPAFTQMLGRAFSRIIPFDGLSYLVSSRGWHDSLSGTYVTKGKYDWEVK